MEMIGFCGLTIMILECKEKNKCIGIYLYKPRNSQKTERY